MTPGLWVKVGFYCPTVFFLCLKVAGAGNLSGGDGGGDVAAAMLEWEEGDRFSFEDSDRFEEDSLCSWSSEPESVCNNWRGWKKPTVGSGSYNYGSTKKSADGKNPCIDFRKSLFKHVVPKF